MATPIWFSGSSPDAALAREDQWRRERTNVLEGDRNSRAQAESMSMQAFLNNQSREDQLREMDLSRNQRADEVAESRQLNMQNFFARQAERASEIEAQKPLMAATIAELTARTKSMNPLLKVAQSAADNGLILDPKEAAVQFNIPIDTAKALHAQSKLAQAEIDKQDAELATAASQLTRYNAANNALKTLAPALKGGFFGDSQAVKDSKAKHESDEAEQKKIIAQLEQRVKFLQNPKRQDILDRLDSDPATGAYLYNPPPRPWRTKGATTSTGTSPAFFSPPPAPTGNAGGGYFPPPPQPSSTGAMNKPPFVRQNGIVFQLMPDGSYKPASRR